MDFSDSDKQLLVNNAAVVLSRMTIFDENDTPIAIFSEDDHIVNWEYEDFRYVPDNGFIGQFVERLLDGTLKDVPSNIDLNNKEIYLELGIKAMNSQNVNYYDYGRFIITSISEGDTTGNISFEASDYAKKFNAVYNPTITFPCTALELLDNTCAQAGVQMNSTEECVSYTVPIEGLTAGDYYFTYEGDNVEYFSFSLENDLHFRDSLILKMSSEELLLTTVDSDYHIHETILDYTVSSSSGTGTLLNAISIDYMDFANNAFVIESNQFESDESCREVVKAIAKLAYSWARITEDDKLSLDFSVKTSSDVDTYDIIDTDKYYTADKTGDTVQPINKVLIGLSDVDGENIYSKFNYVNTNVDTINNAFIPENTLTGTLSTSSSGLKILYIPVTGGKSYTINKKIGKTFRVATSIDEPEIGVSLAQCHSRSDNIDTEDTYTIHVNEDANYLLLNYYRGSNPSEDHTEQEIFDSISITDEEDNTLFIYDNPITYSEELRRIAINKCDKLYGLTYTPVEINSIGHPWLLGDEYIKFENLSLGTIYTYPFNRTLTYEGYIKSKIASNSESNTDLKYEWDSGLANRIRHTELSVDKANGDITLLTTTTQRIEDNINNNYYTIEQTNTLIQNAATGVTNTFSEAGGNNIFHNTGLWYAESEENHYEYWQGTVVRKSSDYASNGFAFSLLSGTLTQSAVVPNGDYTVSFRYKKSSDLGTVKCVINGVEYPLTSTYDTEFNQVISVSTQMIQIDFISSTNEICEVYDIMVNAGKVKLAYSQNQNEIITDTVNISKGITIKSSATDTTFKADSSGLRILDKRGNVKTKFTDAGTETDQLVVHNQAQIIRLLYQEVGDQIWVSIM